VPPEEQDGLREVDLLVALLGQPKELRVRLRSQGPILGNQGYDDAASTFA